MYISSSAYHEVLDQQIPLKLYLLPLECQIGLIYEGKVCVQRTYKEWKDCLKFLRIFILQMDSEGMNRLVTYKLYEWHLFALGCCNHSTHYFVYHRLLG